MSYNSLSSSSRLCEEITFSNSFFLSSSSIFAVSWMLSFSTTLSSLWILSECPYLSFSLGCFGLFPGRFSDKDLFPDEFSDLVRFPGLFSDGNLELLTASDPQLLCNLFILLFTFALKSSNVGFKTICYNFFFSSANLWRGMNIHLEKSYIKRREAKLNIMLQTTNNFIIKQKWHGTFVLLYTPSTKQNKSAWMLARYGKFQWQHNYLFLEKNQLQHIQQKHIGIIIINSIIINY